MTITKPSTRQLWILARLNPTSDRDIRSRADALWTMLVLYRKHGVRKPPEAYRDGEPVHCFDPLALTCWIWQHLDPDWSPPTSTATRIEHVEWLRRRGWAHVSIFETKRPPLAQDTEDERQATLEGLAP